MKHDREEWGEERASARGGTAFDAKGDVLSEQVTLRHSGVDNLKAAMAQFQEQSTVCAFT